MADIVEGEEEEEVAVAAEEGSPTKDTEEAGTGLVGHGEVARAGGGEEEAPAGEVAEGEEAALRDLSEGTPEIAGEDAEREEEEEEEQGGEGEVAYLRCFP